MNLPPDHFGTLRIVWMRNQQADPVSPWETDGDLTDVLRVTCLRDQRLAWRGDWAAQAVRRPTSLDGFGL